MRSLVDRRPGVLVIIGFMSVLGPRSRNAGKGGGPIGSIGGKDGGSKLKSAADGRPPFIMMGV